MEEPYLALYVRDDALCFAKKFPTEGIFEEDSVLMKTFDADSWRRPTRSSMTTWATASTTQCSRLDKGLLMIDDAIAECCVSEIAKLSPFGKEVISYEIQDDFQFVLLSVVTDGVSDVSPLDRKRIAALVDCIVPKRSGDYSWMVNFLLKEAIFDSYFGGDLMSPDSGL